MLVPARRGRVVGWGCCAALLNDSADTGPLPPPWTHEERLYTRDWRARRSDGFAMRAKIAFSIRLSDSCIHKSGGAGEWKGGR